MEYSYKKTGHKIYNMDLISKDGKYNFLKDNNELLSDIWFECYCGFVGDFMKISLNGKFNLINTEGKLISNIWFDVICSEFENGFCAVKLDEKWNYINSKGKILSKKWFKDVHGFINGESIVFVHDKYCIIDTKGNIREK